MKKKFLMPLIASCLLFSCANELRGFVECERADFSFVTSNWKGTTESWTVKYETSIKYVFKYTNGKTEIYADSRFLASDGLYTYYALFAEGWSKDKRYDDCFRYSSFVGLIKETKRVFVNKEKRIVAVKTEYSECGKDVKDPDISGENNSKAFQAAKRNYYRIENFKNDGESKMDKNVRGYVFEIGEYDPSLSETSYYRIPDSATLTYVEK